jgi:hypothetical protein
MDASIVCSGIRSNLVLLYIQPSPGLQKPLFAIPGFHAGLIICLPPGLPGCAEKIKYI